MMRNDGFCATLACAAIGVLVATASESATPTKSQAQPSGAAHALGTDCSGCHTPDAWGDIQGRAGDSDYDHRRTGFALTGQHRGIACLSCHKPDTRIKRACVTCHDDTHQGRFSQRCDTCHRPTAWADTQPIAMHRRTRLPLTGMHAVLDCSQCHKRLGERRWSGVPAACFACHEQAYRRPDIHPPHTGTATRAPLSRRCEACHQTISWSPAFLDPASLGGSAFALGRQMDVHDLRFPIRFGAHAGLDCAACHTQVDSNPRQLQCHGCHTPMTLQRQHPGRPLSSDAHSCLHCHRGAR